MTKHIRRVPASFDQPATDTPPADAPSPDAGASSPGVRADGGASRKDAAPEH